MQESNSWLSAYPAIKALLSDLLAGAEHCLPEFTGMYVYGSLTAGCFNPNTSDIDFIVVNHIELDAAQMQVLNAMHGELLSEHPDWATKLEGSYFTREGIRCHDPQHMMQVRWSYGADQLALEGHGSEWDIHRYMLRQSGLALAGPPPTSLIDPVLPEQLRSAVHLLLAEWWEPMLRDNSKLLDLTYRNYAVATMCRMLYTLRHGEIVPKPDAARWAVSELDPKWEPLIRESLAWPFAERPESLAETMDMIRMTCSIPG